MFRGRGHRQAGQRGEGKIGCIFWCLLFIVGAVIAWEAVPVKIRSSQLYDYMIDQAAIATYNRSEEQLKKRILAKARDLDIPLHKDKLLVKRVGDNIRMKATYTIPVELPGYTYYWDFEHEIQRELYIF